jgi:hypothetical protein
MVHFPELASIDLFDSVERSSSFTEGGSPIRKFPDQHVFAIPRDLSQLTTSFIAFRRLGIHRVPLVA